MNRAKPRYWAVVAAGGHGSRMGPGQPKQYRILAGKTILEHSVSQLLGVERLAGVFVGADRELAQPVIEQIQQPTRSAILRRSEPAATRAGTVLAALEIGGQRRQTANAPFSVPGRTLAGCNAADVSPRFAVHDTSGKYRWRYACDR